MSNLRKKIEDVLTANAFAEAGHFKIAREILNEREFLGNHVPVDQEQRYTTCSRESIESILDLQTPAHIVHFYRTEQELHNTLSPIFETALQRDYGCIFVSENRSITNVMSTATRQTDSSSESNRIISLTEEIAHFGKAFSRIKTTRVTRVVKRLIGCGCKKIIGINDMSWIKRLGKHIDNPFNYESQVNIDLFLFPIITICQYGMREFSRQELLQALCTHPLLLHQCVVYKNDLYIPPPTFSEINWQV